MDHPFENLRLQAEAETAGRTTSKRPTWAPALAIDGEFFDNCVALERLKETDKPVVRLWAIFADPKHRGQVVREAFSKEPLPGHSCRGFELRAGTTHGGEVVWRTQKSVRGGEAKWTDGPRWRGPSGHAESQLEDAQTRYRKERALYETPREWLTEEMARLHLARIDARYLPHIEKLTAQVPKAKARYLLLVRSFELGAQRVAAFVGDVEGERRAGAQLTGSCAICGRALTDPISVERGIGPECIKYIAIRDLASGKLVPWRLSA
jgi:hypothetical protein